MPAILIVDEIWHHDAIKQALELKDALASVDVVATLETRPRYSSEWPGIVPTAVLVDERSPVRMTRGYDWRETQRNAHKGRRKRGR